MNERQQVGARIKEAREARGWSQVRLAEEAGVSEGTVTSAELGKRKTQGDKIDAIFDALGMARLEDSSQLDMIGVPEDARAFLRVATRRFAAMDEGVRTRLLNALYPLLIEEEPEGARLAREAIERHEAALLAERERDTPNIEDGVTSA